MVFNKNQRFSSICLTNVKISKKGLFSKITPPNKGKQSNIFNETQFQGSLAGYPLPKDKKMDLVQDQAFSLNIAKVLDKSVISTVIIAQAYMPEIKTKT